MIYHVEYIADDGMRKNRKVQADNIQQAITALEENAILEATICTISCNPTEESVIIANAATIAAEYDLTQSQIVQETIDKGAEVL